MLKIVNAKTNKKTVTLEHVEAGHLFKFVNDMGEDGAFVSGKIYMIVNRYAGIMSDILSGDEGMAVLDLENAEVYVAQKRELNASVILMTGTLSVKEA